MLRTFHAWSPLLISNLASHMFRTMYTVAQTTTFAQHFLLWQVDFT